MKGISYYKTMNKPLICILLFPFLLSMSPVSSAQTPPSMAVVHAVLFYSPNCGHCHLVITESLPPLFEQYGEQLTIVGVDVTQPDGQALFLAALQYFNLESGGVPFLVIGDTYLVGSIDIPEKFPGLIEQYLAQGGVDWPAIPGLAEAMAPAQPTEAASPIEATPTNAATTIPASPTPVALNPTPTPGLLMTGDHSGGLGANFARDLQGNTLAVIVLALMMLSVGGAISYLRRAPNASTDCDRSRPLVGLANPRVVFDRPGRGWISGLCGNCPGRSRVRAGGRLQYCAAKRIRPAVWRFAHWDPGRNWLSDDSADLGCWAFHQTAPGCLCLSCLTGVGRFWRTVLDLPDLS